MEPIKSWVLNSGRSKHLKPNHLNKSWEEAFMEDAAGPFGAFVWPPKSYSCDFCGREFRSAQALGGHMNIHRRDRAMLKQPHSPPSDFLDHIDTKRCFLGYNESSYDDDNLEKRVTCKRRRTDSELSLAYPVDNHLQRKDLMSGPSEIEELDLELRLGY